METRTLKISRTITKDEIPILDDYKKVIDIVGKNIAYTDLFENEKSNTNFILFYIIQASYGFIRSIFNLWIDQGYHSSYILARALVEYYINLGFILKKNSEKRATEFINAYTKGIIPFKNSKFKYISNRAKNAGLFEHYKKDYISLCSFTHVNLKGSLIARRSEKFKKDKKIFLRNMLLIFVEMFELISKKTNITYPRDMEQLLIKIQCDYTDNP